jgi:hypothetical protein
MPAEGQIVAGIPEDGRLRAEMARTEEGGVLPLDAFDIGLHTAGVRPGKPALIQPQMHVAEQMRDLLALEIVLQGVAVQCGCALLLYGHVELLPGDG